MTADAKQNLSEVIRRSRQEPQEIFRRDRLVAAVISARDYERFEQWREAEGGKTLGTAFSEVREIASKYDYELEVPERTDRSSWVDEK